MPVKNCRARTGWTEQGGPKAEEPNDDDLAEPTGVGKVYHSKSEDDIASRKINSKGKSRAERYYAPSDNI